MTAAQGFAPLPSSFGPVMSVVSNQIEPVSPFDARGAFGSILSSRTLALMIIGVAALQQALGHVNCDSSWFITFAEKVFLGARPYVDVSDPNPPAGFLAYMPAVWLSHGTGIRVEPIVVAMTFLAALASIALAGVILTKVDSFKAGQALPAFSLTSFCLLLLPGFCFTEREHLALILLLPMLAFTVVISSAPHASFNLATLRFLAGFAAGLVLTFKPYYALPVALLLLYEAWQRASIKALISIESLTAALVTIAYGASVFVFYPAYIENVLPVARDIYLPARETFLLVLATPAFVVNIVLLGLVLCNVRRLKDPFVGLPFFASLGFAATFLIQSKGWTNHAYPGAALAIMAAGFLFLRHDEARKSLGPAVFWPILILSPLLFGAQTMFADSEEYPGLVQAVKSFNLVHPKIAVLAEQVDLGHPLVRQVDGEWIGRQNCLWTSYEARTLLHPGMSNARRETLLNYIRADEKAFAQDIQQGQPDLILVETQALEKRAQENPELQPVFVGYNKAAKVGDVSIWRHAAQQ